jgi:hypothetical protein
MNKINDQITTDDARNALDTIAQANKTTVNSMKPPLWLVLLCSVALGIKTTAMALMIDNNLWHSIQWVSYIAICLSVVSWIVVLRTKGIRVKVVDVNIAKMGIISALLICTLLVAARAIYLQTGSILFPSIAGFLNALVLALTLQFNLRLNVTAKEKTNG